MADLFSKHVFEGSNCHCIGDGQVDRLLPLVDAKQARTIYRFGIRLGAARSLADVSIAVVELRCHGAHIRIKVDDLLAVGNFEVCQDGMTKYINRRAEVWEKSFKPLGWLSCFLPCRPQTGFDLQGARCLEWHSLHCAGAFWVVPRAATVRRWAGCIKDFDDNASAVVVLQSLISRRGASFELGFFLDVEAVVFPSGRLAG